MRPLKLFARRWPFRAPNAPRGLGGKAPSEVAGRKVSYLFGPLPSTNRLCWRQFPNSRRLLSALSYQLALLRMQPKGVNEHPADRLAPFSWVHALLSWVHALRPDDSHRELPSIERAIGQGPLADRYSLAALAQVVNVHVGREALGIAAATKIVIASLMAANRPRLAPGALKLSIEPRISFRL